MSTTQPIRDTALLHEFMDFYLKKERNIRNYTLCVLGLNTALRITDVLELRWGDLYNFDRNCFLQHLTVTEKKTGKTNTIALNRSVITTLTIYKEQFPFNLAEDTFLFPSRKGINRPISRSQAFRIIKRAARAVGLDHNVSCHSLRKTFGYHAWRQGTPPALLMNIYNHSSYQVTKRYLGIEQDDRDNVFRNIAL
ncbi:MAG: tyrosine-type recombinase/integrase [Clostridium sp.]|nr:tyrosine-type recombinase/integrase [Candidatus Gastranaerophilales bacterium]MCM1528312.1 tyrosine-type recombinase/integrase [Bacteroides sp.]MCM1563691.1 tyrosine-type recombinase/integrase [Clostridium sp.]